MKFLSVVILVFVSVIGFCQSAIPSYPLTVGYGKTTNLIFPYRIEKADIGSGDVIGHKDLKLGNVLFLKANRQHFAATNLSVYTSDGKFYSFLVRYADEPDTLNFSFRHDSDRVFNEAGLVNEAVLDSDARLAAGEVPFMNKCVWEQGVKLVLDGIYLRDARIWFRFQIQNDSPIDYMPERVRFFIKDRHRGRRTAVQENEIVPECRTDLVFGFPVFTIARHKKLVIGVSEKNGGRLLELSIPARLFMKSRLIN